MINFINRKNGGGGGDGSSLNIFTQLTEPTIKKGIWLQKEAEPEHYTYDEEIFIGGEYLSDGVIANIPNQFNSGKYAVKIGNDIFLFTTHILTNSSSYTTLYKYNTLTNTYTQLSSTPVEMCKGAIASVGTDIFLFGSGAYRNSSPYYPYAKYCYKYNTLTDTYTKMANIPIEFYNSSDYYSCFAVPIGTDIYIGGRTSYIYKYDTLTNTYTQMADFSVDLERSAAINIGTNIYIFGCYYSQYINCYKYDTLTNTYTQIANYPVRGDGSNAIAIGTDIYIFGGASSTKKAYKYNTLNDTYTQLTDLPFGYYNGGIALVDTNIYLFGGSDKTKVQVYVTESKTYQQDNLVVISQGKYSNVGYEIELYSNSKDVTPPKYAFADAWYYTTQGGLETNIPTYYGNGTSWINIKNPPSNNSGGNDEDEEF